MHTLTCAIMLLNTDLHGQVSTWEERLWDPTPRRGQERLWETGEGSRLAGQAFPPAQPAVPTSLHATEHWEEHELPGIHKQPERPAGWQELSQGAAEGALPGLPTEGSHSGPEPGSRYPGDAALGPGFTQITSVY